MKRRHTRRAFSLLELTLVLLIIGILGAVAAVNVLGQGDKAKLKATKITLGTIGSAAKQYILENSEAPVTIQALVTDGYIESGKTKDGWGRQLVYRPTPDGPNEFELISLGKKPDDDTDNINYWLMNE